MVDPDRPALLLTPRDAAEALSLSPRTLWGLTRSGEIPAVRVGRSVRYAVADLRAFVERKRREGGAE